MDVKYNYEPKIVIELMKRRFISSLLRCFLERTRRYLSIDVDISEY